MHITNRNILVTSAMILAVNLAPTVYSSDANKMETWERLMKEGRPSAMAERHGEIIIGNPLREPIIAYVEGLDLCKVASEIDGDFRFLVHKSKSVKIPARKSMALDYIAALTGGVLIPESTPLPHEKALSVIEQSKHEMHLIAPKLVWYVEWQGERGAKIISLNDQYKQAYDMEITLGQTTSSVTAKPDSGWSNRARQEISRIHLQRLIEARKHINPKDPVIHELQMYYNQYYYFK
ncbi:MAG TPA: hypothetical protein VEL47_06935 [Myxococcota bacterium]|nr:hypothetical protein [Myxococcota bacterium]